jgi:hypothetical protein
LKTKLEIAAAVRQTKIGWVKNYTIDIFFCLERLEKIKKRFFGEKLFL